MRKPIACAALVATLAACAAPRYQGGPVDPARLAAVRAEMAGRLGVGRSREAPAPPTRDWAEPELRAIFARLSAAATPLCAAEGVDCRFALRIVAGDEENAYASGRGNVTITRAMLGLLASEGEVAFVLAHEIGHHLGSHLQEMRTATTTGAVVGGMLLGALVAVAGGSAYDLEDALDIGATFGEAGAGSRYSLAAETEADYVGAYLAARAGYDPGAGKATLLRLAELRGSEALEQAFLASHPSSPERIVANEQAAREIAAKRASGQPLLPNAGGPGAPGATPPERAR